MPELFILFVKGLGLGIAVAAPVGPVGALCIRRAVTAGKMAAITSGIGAAVADALYGSVAAFGLTAVSAFMIRYQDPAAFGGGIFLLWLSYKIVISSKNSVGASTAESSGILFPETTFTLIAISRAPFSSISSLSMLLTAANSLPTRSIKS